MGRQYVVEAEELTVEGFAPYGQAILVAETAAPKVGDDWDCWLGLGHFGTGEQSVGFVRTRPTGKPIVHMERHLGEFLVPVASPVVQAMAVPGDLHSRNEKPDAATVRAFIIRPGQAIVMAVGAWHWAALPLRDEEVLYYFIAQPTPPGPGQVEVEWVPFRNGDTVCLQLP